MPATELAFFITPTTEDGDVTPGFLTAGETGLRVQDEWCAASRPGRPLPGREARGAAVFQQVEDPATTLVTAHWVSVAEHGAWIASPENARVYSGLKEHIDRDDIRYFHVDGVEAFSSSPEAGGRGSRHDDDAGAAEPRHQHSALLRGRGGGREGRVREGIR